MLFCLHCGSEIGSRDPVCARCGTRQVLPGTPAAAPEAPAAPPPEAGGGLHYAPLWRRAAAFLVDVMLLNFLLYWSNNLPFPWGLGLLLAYPLYFAGIESSRLQATLGKMLFGIIVTDLNGKRISPLRATARQFAKLVAYVPCCLGFLVAAFSERRQALHDLLAGTLVVQKATMRGLTPQTATEGLMGGGNLVALGLSRPRPQQAVTSDDGSTGSELGAAPAPRATASRAVLAPASMSNGKSPRILDVALGVGLALLFEVGLSILLSLALWWAGAHYETNAAAKLTGRFLPVAIFFPGIIQLVYIVPAVLMARRRGRAGIATGLIWGAALIFLLNAAFFFMVYLFARDMKGFHL